MKKAVSEKLRSNEGASLLIALLLFLVCAIVSSVILTAGTAAAGRLSKKAELDQKYYLVNSAAEILAEELEGKMIIKEEKTDEVSAITYKDMNGNTITAGINDSLLFDLARGDDNLKNTKTIYVSYDGKTVYAYYDISVDSNGEVKISIRDIKEKGDVNAYTVTLLFSGDINTSTDDTNNLITTRYRWFLKDIQKGE
ncbi:MAG: hypothetical protein IJI66_00025 [Erysipelotrichaceae bacterium]|nr:hypothetical protein [Erysipelotrichaceae bacterium]